MNQQYDIQLQQDYDLLTMNGDFSICENLNQQVACLLEAVKGDYRQHPNIGIGLSSYLLDEDTASLNRELRLQLKIEQLNLVSLQINNGQILVNIKRQNN